MLIYLFIYITYPKNEYIIYFSLNFYKLFEISKTFLIMYSFFKSIYMASLLFYKMISLLPLCARLIYNL